MRGRCLTEMFGAAWSPRGGAERLLGDDAWWGRICWELCVRKANGDMVNHSQKCKLISSRGGTVGDGLRCCSTPAWQALRLGVCRTSNGNTKPPARVGPPTGVSCKYALTILLQRHQSWRIWQGPFVPNKECKHSWSTLEEPFPPLSCHYTCRTHCIKTSFRALIILMTPTSFPTLAIIG